MWHRFKKLSCRCSPIVREEARDASFCRTEFAHNGIVRTLSDDQRIADGRNIPRQLDSNQRVQFGYLVFCMAAMGVIALGVKLEYLP